MRERRISQNPDLLGYAQHRLSCMSLMKMTTHWVGHVTDDLKFVRVSRPTLETAGSRVLLVDGGLRYPLPNPLFYQGFIFDQDNKTLFYHVCLTDMLLTSPIDRNSTVLPAPSQLKKKIILKHKKLPDSASEVFTVQVDDSKSSVIIREIS